MGTPVLFEHEFRTTRPPRSVYCHQEFLDELAARRNEPAGKRAALMMQRMAVDISRLHYKATSGANRGWRRSRLGGGSGFHFYAWWAPAGAAPLKDAGFQSETDAVYLRHIRHHDNHGPLAPGDSDDYLPLSVPDLRGTEYAPEPWTQPQTRFARSRGQVRILKGHPGSGKTTALLHAADSSQAEHVLYLTFSRELAALARDYFDRFCSNARTFTVLTFAEFLHKLTGATASDPAEARAQFRRDLFHHQRSLGAWTNDIDALYDEMHAHLVGAAVPEAAGRFSKAERICLPEKAYLTHRARYLGEAAANSVLEAARRLSRSSDVPLAERYFPELAVAWRAAQGLSAGSRKVDAVLERSGCIAVDEAQDLTPMEAYVVLELTRRIQSARRPVSLLLAGDEAQTVRATDFEWAWMNDMLHVMTGQPQEFKLTVNLRSPRRIADVVNRAWDLYDYLHKQDRPSGSGYAEIDDDGPDQILYAAVPGAEMGPLVKWLGGREGLALIAFDKKNLPKETLPFVLSPAEAKGLDFHSVCVLNGGALLRRIVNPLAATASDALTRRLGIDQLRVALSRATERLLWVDADPDATTVRESGELLRANDELTLHPVNAEALRTCLEEEELDVEERLQRCEKDARQLVAVKPDLAWSRAQHAVELLGTTGELNCVTDRAARESAYMTMTEVCFQLGLRKKALSPELGKLDLFHQAANGARNAGRRLLASAILATGHADQGQGEERLNRIATAIERVTGAREELPAWFVVEITQRAGFWIAELEGHLDVGDNPMIAQQILPPFFDALGLPDAQVRKEKLAQRSVQILMKSRRFEQALAILERLPEAKPKLVAECYEETGRLEKAARVWLELGERDRALKCYRSIPDFAATLELVRQIEGHAARPSLEWVAELDAVLARRPENFNRTMTVPEKKLLEGMLERGLGVQRKKAAVKKAGAVKRKVIQKPRT